ncbi:CDP-diacylglycerol--serine O-phosphatidyltransferase [candidate division CSSED10-310 bacterium]|uniref:CDP-diacylglycerol--serine O-phosphatidyltransferase n=1 Tax=candidate division CSSED10-310 bacterium TaxID=2855610 RepID=A0ABV6YYW0_UNCC1
MEKIKKKPSQTRRKRTKQFIQTKREVIKSKGIYLLPALFTVANIFCGFYAIITLFTHMASPNPEKFLVRAAVLIIIAAILDGMDGRVAKLTNSTSEFGVQLDSLADVISFGIAPGVLVYAWALADYQRLGWLPAFLFLVCGALRLARFNVQAIQEEDNKYFKGLPIPFGALLIATFVILVPKVQPKSLLSFLIMLMLYGLSYLMISNIPYRSFKEIDLREKKSAKVIFFIALSFVIVFLDPSVMIFLLVLGYVLSGVVNKFLPISWSIDKTLHQEILVPPQDFDDPIIETTPDQADLDNETESS